jgi:hypothetical protein
LNTKIIIHTLNDSEDDLSEAKPTWKLLPIEWDNSPNRERFPSKAVYTNDLLSVVKIQTDCSQIHLYQFQSQPLKDFTQGDKISFSFNIEGDAAGQTLIVRDKTHQRPIPGAIFPLQDGSNIKQDVEYIVPQGTNEITILIYNPTTMDSKTFTINSLEIKKIN